MAHRTCSVPQCDRPIHGRGWCRNHYQHWAKYGTPLRKSPIDRFWASVEKTDGCWLWQGATPNGYGLFSVDNRYHRAHRWAYEHFVGPIPTGMQLDHLCRVRNCVNPDHLEPVTARENIRRGLLGVLKTHCKQGHPFTPENVIVREHGWRVCRTCRNTGRRISRQRKRLAA